MPWGYDQLTGFQEIMLYLWSGVAGVCIGLMCVWWQRAVLEVVEKIVHLQAGGYFWDYRVGFSTMSEHEKRRFIVRWVLENWRRGEVRA